jgi:hypothetical protein
MLTTIEDIYSFGHPNKTVEVINATRIIALTKGGERDPDRLSERALAACGFTLNRARQAEDWRLPEPAASTLK